MRNRSFNKIFQDCFILVASLNTICVGSVIYSSGTSLVRYLYVRSSLRTEVQDILKRDSFIISSIVVGECINLFNWGSFYYQQLGNYVLEKSPLVLYHHLLSTFPATSFSIAIFQTRQKTTPLLLNSIEKRTEREISFPHD